MKIYLGTILESLLATPDTTDAAVVVVVVDEEGEGVPLKNSNSALRRTISSVIKAIPLRDFFGICTATLCVLLLLVFVHLIKNPFPSYKFTLHAH